MVLKGQTLLRDLTVSTGKTVRGTGVQWIDNSDPIPADNYLLQPGPDGSLYMCVEISEEPIDLDDVAIQSDYITKVAEALEAFPNISPEQLEGLDLTKSILA